MPAVSAFDKYEQYLHEIQSYTITKDSSSDPDSCCFSVFFELSMPEVTLLVWGLINHTKTKGFKDIWYRTLIIWIIVLSPHSLLIHSNAVVSQYLQRQGDQKKVSRYQEFNLLKSWF